MIQIVYDANGNKLQRKFTPEGGTTKITTYVNEFVYEGDYLSYINFEEGHIRVLTPVSVNNGFDGLAIDGNMDLPGGRRGAYDYFIRDYQQNVRIILTEQTHTSLSQCTMESERAVNEEAVFGQSGSGNEVVKTRTAKPPGWAGNASAKVSRLSSSANKGGPNVLLKVMAGDEISAAANYYYQNPVTNSTGNNLTGPVITSLIQSVLGSAATGVVKGNTAGISGQLNANAEFLSKTAPDAGNPGGNNPKAYLTVLFFNERFEFVSEGSTALRVTRAGDNAPALVIPNIKSPKNGYAYVYLSNESNEAVYFDDFKVAHTRGRIIEENHYYAFGFRIAGISSVKFGEDEYEGSLRNDYLYNDKELWIDADLNWYDYGFRNYDPQIGRFQQLDPLTWDYPHYTPYQYSGNEPIANIDLDGLEEFNALQTLSEVVITMPPKSAIVGGFKATMNAMAKPMGVLANLIPDSKVGEGMVGVLTGMGGATADAVKGTYGMVRHPLTAAKGLARMGTTEGQMEAAFNFSYNYVDSKARYGEGFTNAEYISYGATSVGIAVAGPKFGSGIRGTTAAAKGGFDAVGAFKNAISPFKGGNLTNAGRAVTKHSQYFNFESTEALMKVYRTPGALNNLGSSTLKDILRNGVRTSGR